MSQPRKPETKGIPGHADPEDADRETAGAEGDGKLFERDGGDPPSKKKGQPSGGGGRRVAPLVQRRPAILM